MTGRAAQIGTAFAATGQVVAEPVHPLASAEGTS